MTNSAIRLPIALAAGLLFGGAARAGYMDWSYHWSISPAPVLSSGTGSVAQALGPAGMGARRILAAAVTTSSDATAQDPDRFNANFHLTLHLTDLAKHLSGSLTFTGNLHGWLTYDGAHLTESFHSPIEHLRLGNHMYWVVLPNHFRLRPPGSLVVPTFYASVLVVNLPPPPPYFHPGIRPSSITTASIVTNPNASSTPEPSGLVLGSLSVVLLGCAFVRRIWG
jgi:hypothetical protein